MNLLAACDEHTHIFRDMECTTVSGELGVDKAAEFSGPITWTTAMDIGGERVATVSGFMNMLGHFGGSVAPAVTGMLLAWTSNGWEAAFLASAGIYAAGALCWIVIDPVTPIRE